jgi:hypothetical protein
MISPRELHAIRQSCPKALFVNPWRPPRKPQRTERRTLRTSHNGTHGTSRPKE